MKITSEMAVTLIDRSEMPEMELVTRAAWTSFDNTEKPYDEDKGESLCKYLWRDQHWVPFGHVGEVMILTEGVNLNANISAWLSRFDSFGVEHLGKRGDVHKIYMSLPRVAQFNKLIDGPTYMEWLKNSGHGRVQPHGDYERITFKFDVPIFVARQMMRSNAHIVWSEKSGRYKPFDTVFLPNEWRKKPEGSIKQGSGGRCAHMYDAEGYNGGQSVDEEIREDLLPDVFKAYEAALLRDVAPEHARMILPVATMTSIVATAPRWRWREFVNLRSHSTAQLEIQNLAASIKAMAE